MLHLLRTEVFSGVDQDMGGDEAACNISLGLGLGLGGGESRGIGNEEKPVIQFRALFPPGAKKGGDEEHGSKSLRRSSSEDEGGATDHKDPASNHRGGTRKKLRLTQEQSTLLEESFRWNNTLNQVQKQELAERLNLRPRQVEVWFQNRRARTKLKQTEVDCEFLKKCCENLSEENLRLRKELEGLRSTMKGSPFYTPLAVCPSCERAMATNGSGGGGCGGSSGSMSSEAVTVAEMPPELFN